MTNPTITVPHATKYGTKLLISGTNSAHVNALTAQRIPHNTPVVVELDAWVEMQLAAGVLKETKL